MKKFNPYYHRSFYRSVTVADLNCAEYILRSLKEHYNINPHLKHSNGKQVRDTKQSAIRAAICTFFIRRMGFTLKQAGSMVGLSHCTVLYHRENHYQNMRLTHKFGEFYAPCYDLCETIYNHITRFSDENKYEKMALVGLDPTVGYIKRVTPII